MIRYFFCYYLGYQKLYWKYNAIHLPIIFIVWIVSNFYSIEFILHIPWSNRCFDRLRKPQHRLFDRYRIAIGRNHFAYFSQLLRSKSGSCARTITSASCKALKSFVVHCCCNRYMPISRFRFDYHRIYCQSIC